MRKIWVIAQKELYQTYTDVNLLLIMLATPVVLATIIGLALGGAADGDSIGDIPVAIVNQDEGDFGSVIVSAYIPSQPLELGGFGGSGGGDATCDALPEDTETQPFTLEDITDAELVDSTEVARAGVDDGTYAAAVIVPPDFSARIGYSQDDPTIDPVTVEVYGDSGRTLSAEIIRSITESITTQIATGNIFIASAIETIQAQAPQNPAFYGQLLLYSVTGDPNEAFVCAFDPNFNTVGLEQQTVTGDDAEFDPLVYFGAAQAMFFMLFTAQGGANSILEDRRQWVLQRMVVSPTPRLVILLGKLVGTFVTCVFQLLLLFVAFTAVGSIMNGEFVFIWGRNVPLIALLVVVAALSASGLGTLLAALARNPEQANTVGTIINIAMAAVGGAFFNATFMPQVVQWFSIVYWGTDAFTALSAGQTAIWTNLGVLLLQGAVMFLVGLWVFERQMDV